MQLEERLGALYGKHEIDGALNFLNKLIDENKFKKDTPDNRFRFCQKFITNRREEKNNPKKSSDRINIHVAENLFKIIEKKHGMEWVRERHREVKQLKITNPTLHKRIEQHARTSYVYHKHLVEHSTELDPSERIELEKMCLEKSNRNGKIEMTEERQRISDKVNEQMKGIETRAMAKAMVCVYVCYHMDSKTIFNDEVGV